MEYFQLKSNYAIAWASNPAWPCLQFDFQSHNWPFVMVVMKAESIIKQVVLLLNDHDF